MPKISKILKAVCNLHMVYFKQSSLYNVNSSENNVQKDVNLAQAYSI